jgi:hypothetical protein
LHPSLYWVLKRLEVRLKNHCKVSLCFFFFFFFFFVVVAHVSWKCQKLTFTVLYFILFFLISSLELHNAVAMTRMSKWFPFMICLIYFLVRAHSSSYYYYYFFSPYFT